MMHESLRHVSDIIKNVLEAQGFHFPHCVLPVGAENWHSVTRTCTCSLLSANKQGSGIWRDPGVSRFTALMQHCICRITWPHKYWMRLLHTLLPLRLPSCALRFCLFPRRAMGSWTSYSKVKILYLYKAKSLFHLLFRTKYFFNLFDIVRLDLLWPWSKVHSFRLWRIAAVKTCK